MIISQFLHKHLIRLSVTSAILLLVGVAFANRTNLYEKGLSDMLIGWSVINLIIVFFSLRSKKPPEQPGFSRFLMVNLGLNCLYIVGGTAMLIQGNRIGGMGLGIILQGFNLLALDSILHFQTRSLEQK